MNLSDHPLPYVLLLAAGFVLQGLLVVREDPGGALFVLPLFGALAVATAVRLPGLGGLLVGSAAFGGLGMAAGRVIDALGGAALHSGHQAVAHAQSPLFSWSGLLMLAGCTAACFLPVGSPAARPRALVHHGSSVVGMLVGMLAGMQLLHSAAGLGGVELPAWGLHLAMVAAMLAGGWAVLALVSGFTRRPRVGR